MKVKLLVENTGKYVSIALRTGLGILFLLFGLSQISNPNNWISWVPQIAIKITPLDPTNMVVANGLFELLLSLLILSGFLTRISAVIASLHLFGLLFAVGYNEIGMRDFAIFTSAVALALSDDYPFSLDNFIASRRKRAH